MTTRERPADRGRRAATRDLAVVATELRRARLGAGLSLRAIAGATRVPHVRVWRFERGQLAVLDVDEMGAIAAAVGLDLRLKVYPAGDGIRDVGQARLLERLRRALHPMLEWRTEVPLAIGRDTRAWDAVISGPGWRLAVEAETVLADVQAVERRISIKARDGNADHVLVVLADTRRNRAALDASPAAFGRFLRRSRPVLRALRAGRSPECDALVLL